MRKVLSILPVRLSFPAGASGFRKKPDEKEYK